MAESSASRNLEGWEVEGNGYKCNADSSILKTDRLPTPIQKLQCHLDYIDASVKKISGTRVKSSNRRQSSPVNNAVQRGLNQAKATREAAARYFESAYTGDESKTLDQQYQEQSEVEKINNDIKTTIFNNNEEEMNKWDYKVQHSTLHFLVLLFKKKEENIFLSNPNEPTKYAIINENNNNKIEIKTFEEIHALFKDAAAAAAPAAATPAANANVAGASSASSSVSNANAAARANDLKDLGAKLAHDIISKKWDHALALLNTLKQDPEFQKALVNFRHEFNGILTPLERIAIASADDKKADTGFSARRQKLIMALIKKGAEPSQETIKSLEDSGFSLKTDLTDEQINQLKVDEDKKRDNIRKDKAAAAATPKAAAATPKEATPEIDTLFNQGRDADDNERRQILNTVFQGSDDTMNKWIIKITNNDEAYVLFKKNNLEHYTGDPMETGNFYYSDNGKIKKGIPKSASASGSASASAPAPAPARVPARARAFNPLNKINESNEENKDNTAGGRRKNKTSKRKNKTHKKYNRKSKTTKRRKVSTRGR